jgi:hypothetical protein
MDSVAPDAKPAPKAQTAEERLAELIKALSAITDPVERKKFYWANSELQRIYSTVNFH